MARQKGVIKLQGQMGGVSFYKSQDGYLAREKGGVDSERVRSDPAFERTRENGAEFGRAGVAGKLLRTAFRSLLIKTADNRMASRLTREMVRVIQADQVSPRGKRNVIDGEAALLQGFEFNNNGKLAQTFFPSFAPTFNRATGAGQIQVSAFVPEEMIVYPEGATHFVLSMGIAFVDFENGSFSFNSDKTTEIEITNLPTPAINLQNSIAAAIEHPAFMAFGIEFYQEVNGAFYSLKNGAFNALSLVLVDGGA